MKNAIVIAILLAFTTTGNAQKIFPIWSGAAAGTENWTWHSAVDSTSIPGDPLTYNIVQPVLLFFAADPALANGTAVIICPGGSFHAHDFGRTDLSLRPAQSADDDPKRRTTPLRRRRNGR